MKLIYIGSKKQKDLTLESIFEDYLMRLRHQGQSLEVVILPDEKVKKDSEIEVAKKRAGERVIEKIDDQDLIVVLDENGTSFTSEQFADKLNGWQANAKDIVFIIGGTYGLSDGIIKRADCKISLSKMTFTHDMARVIFAEQLYRAIMINSNKSYHH